MKHTLFYSFAGAGIGFLVAIAIALMTDALSTRDGGAIIMFLGAFLAGPGAIAGAIIGGVADLLVFFKKREEARLLQECREPESMM
jgi:hypothetical protein